MLGRCPKIIYEMPRREYIEGANYRVIQLLLRYRALAEIKCNVLLNEVLGWKLSRDDAECYVGMIDDGNIELSEAEIEKLARYISQSFKYEPATFFNIVKYEALYYENSSDKKTNLRRQVVAISDITGDLK